MGTYSKKIGMISNQIKKELETKNDFNILILSKYHQDIAHTLGKKERQVEKIYKTIILSKRY